MRIGSPRQETDSIDCTDDTDTDDEDTGGTDEPDDPDNRRRILTATQLDQAQLDQAQLDQAFDDKRLLDHPFYKAWAAGRLSTDALAHYAGQYWRQVEAFPSYLGSLRERLDEGSARDTVEDNLADELDGDHQGLWLRFAEAVGVSAVDVHGAPLEPETRVCVGAFRNGTSARSTAFGLGMLYAYESQTPDVARTKVQGLRDHYGIDGDGVSYFELHADLDVEHSAQLVTAIDEVAATPDGRAEAEAGARAGAEAIWTLLDGVARVRSMAQGGC